MNVLKGVALGILSFLLFLSLSVFGLALTLNYTILNPDFVVSEVDRLDISALAEEVLAEQIPEEEEFMVGFLDTAVADLEPWIKEQVSVVTYSSYDYLLGKSQSLSVTIPLEPVKESLRETLREAIIKSPPPQLEGLPPAEIEQYSNQLYQEISQQIPSTFEFNESLLTPEIWAQFQQIRQAIGYFQLGYKLLIGFILLLILGIVLINREVKGATRGIGITFLSYGVLWYAGTFVAKHFAGTQMAQLDIPPYLQGWLPQLLDDLIAPLGMFSLGLLIAGVVLIVVSFVYKPRQTSF